MILSFLWQAESSGCRIHSNVMNEMYYIIYFPEVARRIHKFIKFSLSFSLTLSFSLYLSPNYLWLEVIGCTTAEDQGYIHVTPHLLYPSSHLIPLRLQSSPLLLLIAPLLKTPDFDPPPDRPALAADSHPIAHHRYIRLPEEET